MNAIKIDKVLIKRNDLIDTNEWKINGAGEIAFDDDEEEKMQNA